MGRLSLLCLCRYGDSRIDDLQVIRNACGGFSLEELERAFKCKIETKYSRKGIFCPWFDKLIVNLISYRVGKSHCSAVSKVL